VSSVVEDSKRLSLQILFMQHLKYCCIRPVGHVLLQLSFSWYVIIFIDLLRVDTDSFLNNLKKSLSRKLLHIFRGHSGNKTFLAVVTERCYNTLNVSMVT
jgi:hypothetical protein